MLGLERVIPGIGTAATFIGAYLVIVGQGIFDPVATSIERYVGGSLILAAAYLIVRWTRTFLKDIQLIRQQEQTAAQEREQLLVDQLQKAYDQTAELNAQLTAERQLRLSLEQAGVVDRRGVE